MAVRRTTKRKTSAPARRRTTRRTTAAAPTRRRKRVTRKKSMLSELFNPAMAQAGGKAVISGAVGGASAGLLDKFLGTTMTPNKKAFITLGAGFLSATILKMPNLGAGMAGVAAYNLFNNSGMLAENYDFDQYAYADEIESLPMVLNENGDALALSENDMYLSENDMYLSEGVYNVGYYEPGFGQA